MKMILYGREVDWQASNCAGCGHFRLDIDGETYGHAHCDRAIAAAAAAGGDPQPSLFEGVTHAEPT